MRNIFIGIFLMITSMLLSQEKPYVLEKEFLKISDNGIIYGSYYDHNNFGYKNILIPDSINGQKIIGIENLGSIPNTIEKVTFPVGLRYLGYCVLSNQPIDTITLPSSLVFIDENALNYARLLKIKLPEPSKKDHAFIGWNDSILGLSMVSFENTEKCNIKFQAKFKYLRQSAYILEENDIILVDNSIKKSYYSGSNDIVIPSRMSGNRIVAIDERAFYNHQLKKIEISEGIKVIKGWAFSNNQLTTVSLPPTLNTLEKFSFSRNIITSIKLPQSIKKIGMGCFENNLIEKINIPIGLDSIGSRAFAKNKLKDVKLNHFIVYIGVEAFIKNKLTTEHIPVLLSPKVSNKTFLYWQSFKKGKYNRMTKSFEEIPVAQHQPGDKMDLSLGYKAIFKEDL